MVHVVWKRVPDRQGITSRPNRGRPAGPMDKYSDAPFRDKLAEPAGGIDAEDAAALVFIAPQTSTIFEFRWHKVTRTALPISHGKVLTPTACQGRTMKEGGRARSPLGALQERTRNAQGGGSSFDPP